MLSLSLFISLRESDLAKRRYLLFNYFMESPEYKLKLLNKPKEERLISLIKLRKDVYRILKQKLILEFINYLLVIILFVLLRIQKTKTNRKLINENAY